ncbi:MAG: TolC family protein [Myxococcota bacterium]|nr:TolC family protein [Myxococcota bacterium]
MRVGAWLLASALISGCATIRPERGHDEVATLVKERAGADTGWAAGSPEAEKVAERVDVLLRDGLTADRAVEIALVNNPSLQATYEELGVSQADMVQAGLLTNPSLELSLGFPLSGSAGINEHEFSIVQEFLDLFMLPLKTKVANEQFVADTLRVAHEALTTAAEVRKEVIELQTLQQLLEFQRMLRTAAQAAGDLAVAQYRAGNITDLEVAARRADAEQARVDLAQSEFTIVATRESLNRHLGLWGPRTSWNLKQKLAELPRAEPEFERLESLAIRQRLDIVAARKQAALMRQGADLARTWRWFGRVEVGAHTHQDADGPRLLGPTLTLDLPLFDQRQALIARLEAQQRQGERRLAALSVNARSEVREAQANLAAARQLVLHLKDTVMPLRERVLEQAQLQYNGMQIGLYQLLEAKRDQIGSSRDHLEALRRYWVARVELERIVGGKIGPATKEESDDHPNH